MRRARITVPVLAGLLLVLGVQAAFAATDVAAKRAEEAHQWAAEHPESCALLDNPKAVSMMDALMLKLAVLCGREDLLGGIAQEENQSFDPDALGTDVRANDPGTDSGSSRTQSETSVGYNETIGHAVLRLQRLLPRRHPGPGLHRLLELERRRCDLGGPWRPRLAQLRRPGRRLAQDGRQVLLRRPRLATDLGIWRSDDDCQTFTFVSNPHVSGSDDKELMAIDNNVSSPNYGNIYVAWTDFTDARIKVVTSTNGGTTWSSPAILSAAGVDVQGAWPAIAPNGDVFVDYVRWNPYPSGPIDVEVARSTNGGASFSLVTDPMTGQVNPRDNTATGSCGRPALNGQIRYLPSPQIAVGPDGALHVVYSYDPDGNGTGDVSQRLLPALDRQRRDLGNRRSSSTTTPRRVTSGSLRSRSAPRTWSRPPGTTAATTPATCASSVSNACPSTAA